MSDLDDPLVRSAKKAERTAYDYYDLSYTEHFVDVSEVGVRIRVIEIGSGPPLVLIPGGVGQSCEWLPLLPELQDFTLYVMDRPGGGLSDEIVHRPSSLRQEAVCSTKSLFDFFDLDAAPILGNSMGGWWALRFAQQHPSDVTAIGLLGCPAVYPGTSAPVLIRLITVPFLGRRIVAMNQPDSPEEAREGLGGLGHPTETKQRLAVELFDVKFRMDNLHHYMTSAVSIMRSVLRLRGADPATALTPRDLQSIRQPVSLLWGTEDPFGSVETGRSGARNFPDAEFHEFGTGHLPWLDDPESCGEFVRDFINQLG